MTAEVAIMNKAAVALAADSAITIREKAEKTDKKINKIYTSVNKVFTISKYHPVGIMVYGSADILGRPWEPIIKMYREKLADKSFDYLFDYGKDFIKNIPDKDFFPDDVQELYYYWNLIAYYQLIVEQINEKVKECIEEKGKIKDNEIFSFISNIISEHYNNLENLKYVKGMSQKTTETIEKK